MKKFENFGEYMFDLLFAPLKKGKRATNQFHIFFRVMGREFDDIKTAIFKVRNEANVASCSEEMLAVHGQDRDMPRLEGESFEAYRTRLSMKGIISEWGGTRKGILYALTSLGYRGSRVERLSQQEPKRWAEFDIYLNPGRDEVIRDPLVIYREVQKVKEGSSKLNSIRFTLDLGEAPILAGCAMGMLVRLPIPELADSFDFNCELRTGGMMTARASIPIPEREDKITFTFTERAGVTGSIHAIFPVTQIS